jgi:sugar phosphate isomerase/epimerase
VRQALGVISYDTDVAGLTATELDGFFDGWPAAPDAAGLLRVLREGGYDGWLELEVFSDDGLMGEEFPDSLWREDPVELIRRGRQQTLAAWNTDRQAMGAG